MIKLLKIVVIKPPMKANKKPVGAAWLIQKWEKDNYGAGVVEDEEEADSESWGLGVIGTPVSSNVAKHIGTGSIPST